MILFFMDREGERYWQRNGVFVTVVTALFGLLLVKIGELSPIQNLIIGLLGLVLSWAWFKVLKVSKFYAERWRLDARAFVANHEDLKSILNTVAGTPLLERPVGPGSSDIMRRLSIISGAMWVVVVFVGLVPLVKALVENWDLASAFMNSCLAQG